MIEDNEITVLCPHCGDVNSYDASFIAPGVDFEELHQCQSCLRTFTTDHVEPETIAEHGFILDCSPINIIEPILMPDDEEDLN